MPNMNPKRTMMHIENPDIRKTNFNIIYHGYTEQEAIDEANRCLHCPIPKCKESCPIKNNIPEFINEIKNKDYKKAYSFIQEKSILSDICGTICPHEDQCEGHCVRGLRGESVNIGALERFVSEWANKNIKEVNPIKNKYKVACIGSGPASITFALYLARKGYNVTIYEKESYVGGVLSWGIPSYRLGKEILDNYISRLKVLGVNFVFNYKVGSSHPLEEIIKNYDATFIGTGALNSNKMHIPGEDLKGVYPADEFLSKINLSNDKSSNNYGSKILVVGGGNVAMDASRDAIRLKQVSRVDIVYRRSENEMPACTEELNMAKEEGVIFNTLTNPVKFIGENGVLKKVECAIMELGEPDSSGRRRPIESTKPHIFFDVDSAVLALGFSNDKEIGETTANLNIDKYGCFIVDENNMTSLKNVYAGGDAVTGAKTVVLAMKAGLNAAKDVEKKFK